MTEKQQRFVEEYLVDLNGTQAAIRAGYSPRSAHVTAAKNLRNPFIEVAVQTARKLRAERVEISSDRVLDELAGVAFADPHLSTRKTPSSRCGTRGRSRWLHIRVIFLSKHYVSL